MGTQTQIASQMIAQGDDYALALKENQGTMDEGASEAFTMALNDHFAHIQHGNHRAVVKGHGRIEIREYWTISQAEILTFLDPQHRSQGRVTRDWNGASLHGALVRRERRRLAMIYSVLSHLTLNLLRQEKTACVGIKVKRLKAAWDTRYLQRVLEAVN
jgi:predicted transposase YbfD/YdcC